MKNYPDPALIINQYGADATRWETCSLYVQTEAHFRELVYPRMYLVNSPIVRADNLRFREDGVREVISRVMIPWLSSYEFFLHQVALLKKDFNADFKYDPHRPRSENVMDRWILARCQSLIALVKQEMEGPYIWR